VVRNVSNLAASLDRFQNWRRNPLIPDVPHRFECTSLQAAKGPKRIQAGEPKQLKNLRASNAANVSFSFDAEELRDRFVITGSFGG